MVKLIQTDFQLKEGAKLIQQRSRTLLSKIQPSVEKEFEKLKKQDILKRPRSSTKIVL